MILLLTVASTDPESVRDAFRICGGFLRAEGGSSLTAPRWGGLVEPLHDYALASDVRLHFGDVPISLGKMLLQLSAVHRSKGSTAKAKTPSGEEAGGVLTLGTRKD
jgi:hypothetical protein